MLKSIPVEHLTFPTADSVHLAIDVFRPPENTQRCAVLILHGGGWRVGSKDIVGTRAAALSAFGFTCLASNYRLLGQAGWPAQLVDVAAALRWIREQAASLDIDTENVVVQGHSAGAHLALLAGAFEPDQRPAAINAFYPPVGFYAATPPAANASSPRLPALDASGRLPSWMLIGSAPSVDDLVAASPMDIVHEQFPPTLLLHGTADVAIGPTSTVDLYNRLSGYNVPCELHLYAGLNHEFDRAPRMAVTTARVAASFLERTVSNRAVMDDEARRFSFPPSPEEVA